MTQNRDRAARQVTIDHRLVNRIFRVMERCVLGSSPRVPY